MKSITLSKLFSMALLLTIASLTQAQQTDIEHDSDGNSAHLQLTETENNDFSRLVFKNTGSIADKWAIAGRLGTTASKDFGLFYNGDSRLLYNEDDKYLNLVGAINIKETGFDGDAITIENQNTNKWAVRIVNLTNDLNIYYNNSFRGGFDDATGAYMNSSDKRFKNSIESFENNTLEKVLALNPSKYYYNDDIVKKTKSFGFIAQEVQKLFPELVKIIDPNDPELKDKLMLNYTHMIPVLTKAIQEQQTLINTMQKEIEELKKR